MLRITPDEYRTRLDRLKSSVRNAEGFAGTEPPPPGLSVVLGYDSIGRAEVIEATRSLGQAA